VLFIGIACTMPLVSPPARAEAEVSDATKERAKAHFERGLALSKLQEHEAALQAFLKSREIYPTRTNTQNAALMLKLLGRYDQSIAMLEAMLRQFPELTEEQREAVRVELRELRTNVGTVRVETDAPGADVEVDGRKVGNLPLEAPIIVNPGRHRVRLTLVGGESREAFVQVAAGEAVSVDPPPERPIKADANPASSQPPSKKGLAPKNPAAASDASAMHGVVAFETIALKDMDPAAASDQTVYSQTGTGVGARVGIGVLADSVLVGGFALLAYHSSKGCSRNAEELEWGCSASHTWGGLEVGGVTSIGPIEALFAGRYGPYKMTAPNRSGSNFERIGWKAEFVVAPTFRLGKAVDLGVTSGLATDGMGELGLRCQVRM